jgi:hypothetical protein
MMAVALLRYSHRSFAIPFPPTKNSIAPGEAMSDILAEIQRRMTAEEEDS